MIPEVLGLPRLQERYFFPSLKRFKFYFVTTHCIRFRGRME